MPRLKELEEEYIKKHRRSQELYEGALNCFPSGVSHDGRHAKPFPIYATRAEGTRKWDVDGNEYVDYVMGHGTLLLGYGDERVLEMLGRQIPESMHIGACTELEIEWAELIKGLVPSARDGFVRATSCGSEAVQMGIRLSRIYTGKDKIVVQAGAYHGKQDITIYVRGAPPVGVYNVRGIPQSVRDEVFIVPFNNLEAVEKVLKTGEVACLLHHSNAHYSRDYLEGLRELTTKYGVVFLMDEVVSGFRYAPGGAQEYYGVTPDLTALGKVIGGGVPVGAICGNKEIMELYSFKDDYWNRFVRIAVGGTWNAQPVCIAAGIAMMKIIEEEKDRIYPTIYDTGRRLVKSFNELAHDMGITALANGLPIDDPTTLALNLFKEPVPPNLEYLWQTGPASFEDYGKKASFNAGGLTNYATYLSMLNRGIFSYSGRRGSLCARYSEEDLEWTEEAFEYTLGVLKENELCGLVR
jgi:glutamate-1-semialdehyde 2,1-aminomutase